MRFACAFTCGGLSPKKLPEKVKKMDFRRADPQYVNFVPKTCVDAIDLFNRHRTLGLTANLYPECFVHCARALPEKELDMFHRFIICPDGDIGKGGERPTPVDAEIEKERQELLEEAKVRDKLTILTIEEEKTCPMSDSDEKCQFDCDSPVPFHCDSTNSASLCSDSPLGRPTDRMSDISCTRTEIPAVEDPMSESFIKIISSY